MSNALYPTLAGLTWSNSKAPQFNTKVLTSVSLSELRASFTSTPVYNFELKYDLLRDDATNNELKQIAGFYMARAGSYDSFLFSDPDDSTATQQSFGTGDGVTVTFHLRRGMGSFSEAVNNPQAGSTIYANAVSVANVTVASNGQVTFVAAPAANAALTWSGSYYFRCRFNDDSLGFTEFMRQLWECGSVKFKGSLGSKI